MINLLKHLLMNEFEIAFFTILLDKLGWIYQNMEHWTYFCLLGIYTKKLADNEDESSLLIDLISRDNPYFMDLYINWICDDNIMKKIEENEISVLLINERYKELTAQTNYFCQKNFINFNGIVDKIIKLSQPYGNENNGSKIDFNEKLFWNNERIEIEIKKLSAIKASTSVASQIDCNYKYLKQNLVLKSSKNTLNQFIPKENNIYNDEMSQDNFSNDSMNLSNKSCLQSFIKIDNFINADFSSQY